ncbi:MAG TPA: hypothetical protein VGP89_18055 [Candidatus Angelobacter sp.]|jgi:hypothetical protein|nr:hypothetical protein [Candidatus Angelobacter sp.]
MAVKQTETLIPEAHSKLVVFCDHFGHKHKVVVPTHIATEDPLRLFPVGPVEIQSFDAQLENIAQMMSDREQAFLDHCLDHPEHCQHPLVLSHPDHPTNKKTEPNFDAFEKDVQKDCDNCG